MSGQKDGEKEGGRKERKWMDRLMGLVNRQIDTKCQDMDSDDA